MTRRPTPYAELADVLDRLGAIVREARRARGLTHAQAARQIGIGDATVRRLEEGLDPYTSTTAQAVLYWLGTPAQQPELARSRP